jgi:hypothetical protein
MQQYTNTKILQLYLAKEENPKEDKHRIKLITNVVAELKPQFTLNASDRSTV